MAEGIWRRSRTLGTFESLDYDNETHLFEGVRERLGWTLHSYQDVVGQERPGQPDAQGPFEKMCQSLTQWQFINPHLLQCDFDPLSPLKGRILHLNFRILGLPVRLGWKVCRVFNEEAVNSDGHHERLWGYACRALEGGPDVGEISFRISKDLQTGHLFFAIRTASKWGRMPSLWFRLTFFLFAPGVQKLLSLNALRRMRRLAESCEDSRVILPTFSLSAP